MTQVVQRRHHYSAGRRGSPSKGVQALPSRRAGGVRHMPSGSTLPGAEDQPMLESALDANPTSLRHSASP